MPAGGKRPQKRYAVPPSLFRPNEISAALVVNRDRIVSHFGESDAIDVVEERVLVGTLKRQDALRREGFTENFIGVVNGPGVARSSR